MLRRLLAWLFGPAPHQGEAWDDLHRRVSALEAEKGAARVREAAFVADVGALADKVSNQLRRLAARENSEAKRKAARNGAPEGLEFDLEDDEEDPPFPQEWRRS